MAHNDILLSSAPNDSPDQVIPFHYPLNAPVPATASVLSEVSSLTHTIAGSPRVGTQHSGEVDGQASFEQLLSTTSSGVHDDDYLKKLAKALNVLPCVSGNQPTSEPGVLRVSNVSLCWENQPTISKASVYLKLWTAHSKV